ncbi:MAG: hypothetical protein R6V57_18790, partial [Vicinamibacterales bacterium]
SVHHVAPSFFFGYEDIGQTGVLMASPEKALVDFLYLAPARSMLFRALPELERAGARYRKSTSAFSGDAIRTPVCPMSS